MTGVLAQTLSSAPGSVSAVSVLAAGLRASRLTVMLWLLAPVSWVSDLVGGQVGSEKEVRIAPV